ncbi:MAG: hypothetical protein ACLQIB_05925 [Isosphaeraceae bacterium]
MKRFVLLCVALVLSIPVTGCDDGGVTNRSTPTAPRGTATVAHPDAKGEVAEYEAKEAKRQADRISGQAAKKGAEPASK